MTIAGWKLILLFVALIALLAKPAGRLLFRLYDDRPLSLEARRYRLAGTGSREQSWLKLVAGALEVDPAAHRVTKKGEAVHLTPKEFALLSELARHAGKVLTHRHLLSTIWGEAHIADVE